MGKSTNKIFVGTQKLRKFPKEMGAPPTIQKNLRIKLSRVGKGKSIILTGNLRKLSQPNLMDNKRPEKKQKLG